MDIARPAAGHIKRHTPVKSQTLMRSAVKKPQASLKRSAKTVTHSHALVAQPDIAIIKKLSHPTIDARREKRAHTVPHSKFIQRFAKPKERFASVSTSIVATSASLAPVTTPVSHPQKSHDIFEQALRRANSHLEPTPTGIKRAKRRKSKTGRRVLGASASALAVLLITGFFAFQNEANLTIHYASNKAGFSANLPSYRPAGFKAGNFTYSPGLVGVTFKNGDNQSFSLIQKQSAWDSSALVANYVANADKQQYRSIESAGRTVYLYGNNNATWVNGGIWYRIVSNGSLTTNDLLNVATSI